MKSINGNFKVEWQWIGEGLKGKMTGEYNPHDKSDVPVLRFFCYKKLPGGWEEVWGTSHCTKHHKDSTQEELKETTNQIFNILNQYPILDVGGGTPEFDASPELESALVSLSLKEVIYVGRN